MSLRFCTLMIRTALPVDDSRRQLALCARQGARQSEGVPSRMNTSGGGWQLYLSNRSARAIWLTLASQGAPMPDGFYWASVEVFSTCYTVDSSGSLVATGLVAIAPGTSSNMCNFGVDFATGGIQYQLRMGPEKPGTGWAMVSCYTLPPATACNGW